jgi:hypothetical protein
MRMASASSSAFRMLRTGPKISCRATAMSFVTSAKTVGRTYQPRLKPSGLPGPPEIRRAPSFRPVAIIVCTRCHWISSKSGPIWSPSFRGSPTCRVLRGGAGHLDDLVVTGRLHDQPGGRVAGLAGVEEAFGDGGAHTFLQRLAAIGEDEVRGLAAQFQRHAFDACRRRLW